jgi:cullin-associated NEDD8-dissociated protein 1
LQRGLCQEITELFNSKVEDTKICASIALGQVAVGNLQVFLPVIFEKFSSEEHRYLLLNSIEEVISHKSEHMSPYIGHILPVIFENAERADENVRNISSECLGKLVSVSPDSLIQSIIQKIHSGSVNTKITMVSSIKYIVHQKVHNYSDYMEQVLPILIETLSVPDVHLKRACLVSINSIAHISAVSVKHNFGNLCEKIYLETVIKPDLIRKVDLGAFTHITDDGLPIRKAAFSTLETIIDNLPEKIEANKTLEHVIHGLDDTSDEVQMLCHQLLSKLINWAAGAVTGNLNTIVSHIKKNVEKNYKLLNQKQEVERANDLLRSALRCVEKIETQIETESSAQFREFMAYVAGISELSGILNTIKSQKESLFFI